MRFFSKTLFSAVCVMSLVSLQAYHLAFGKNINQQRPAANYSERGIPNELKDIGIEEHLGAQISIQELIFKNENGDSVLLSEFFKKKKPVILSMGYLGCPMLCPLMWQGLVDSLKPFEWTVGDKYEIITVSIEPKETPSLARKKKKSYIESYGRPEAAEGWHFLTGEETQIKKLADEVGFKFKWDEKDKQYAHGAAIFILTPEGKISRYLYGIEFKQTDLRLALLEASNGKIGTVVDRLLLFCYRYDSETRKYSVYLAKVMQLSCGTMVVIFGGYLSLFWFRQRKGA